MAKIFVGGLFNGVTEIRLQEFISERALIDIDLNSIEIVVDPFTGSVKGFGYIEVDSEETAKTLVERLNGSVFMEKELEVMMA